MSQSLRLQQRRRRLVDAILGEEEAILGEAPILRFHLFQRAPHRVIEHLLCAGHHVLHAVPHVFGSHGEPIFRSRAVANHVVRRGNLATAVHSRRDLAKSLEVRGVLISGVAR